MRSNCLVWAIRQWHRNGGYLVIRRSHSGPFWHFMWSQNLRKVEGYSPIKRKYGWVAVLDKLWFRGQVVEEVPPEGH
jgi:hypothetical protein